MFWFRAKDGHYNDARGLTPGPSNVHLRGRWQDEKRGPPFRDVVVFGAGAFGGWTALELARRGARVMLLDAWGPGNARSSSGGETRVMRSTYGTHSIYTEMATRALDLWCAWDARWQRNFFRRTGALWLLGVEGEGFG